MPIVALAYHPTIAAERLQEHVHASSNLEVGK